MIKIKEFKGCLEALNFIDALRKKKRKGIKLNSKKAKKGYRFLVTWRGKPNAPKDRQR